MLMRCGMSTFDCRTRTQSKTARCVWEIGEDNVRVLDAAQRWGEHYAQVLETGEFSRGVASPCHFFHKDLETCILVHGDDFFIVGRQERKHALSLLRGAYELSKVVTFGPEVTDSEFLEQDTDVATVGNRVRA